MPYRFHTPRPRAGARPATPLALLALMLLPGVGRVSAQTPDPLDILERAAGLYRGTTAFCADFRQELDVPLLSQRTEGRGRLCQRQPNLFSMRFTEPAGDLVVIDGASVWLYYPSRDAKQVLKAPLSAAADGRALDFHREFLEDAGRKYEVEHQGVEDVAGGAAHRILLRPRERARYREAVVWIGTDRPLVRRVVVREENGSVRTIELSGIDLSPRIPEGTFTFTPPPGARVITP